MRNVNIYTCVICIYAFLLWNLCRCDDKIAFISSLVHMMTTKLVGNIQSNDTEKYLFFFQAFLFWNKYHSCSKKKLQEPFHMYSSREKLQKFLQSKIHEILNVSVESHADKICIHFQVQENYCRHQIERSWYQLPSLKGVFQWDQY